MRGRERKHRTHNNQQKTCENWKTTKKELKNSSKQAKKKNWTTSGIDAEYASQPWTTTEMEIKSKAIHTKPSREQTDPEGYTRMKKMSNKNGSIFENSKQRTTGRNQSAATDEQKAWQGNADGSGKQVEQRGRRRESSAHREEKKREKKEGGRERESVHGPGRQQDGPVRGSTRGTETAGGKKTRLKAHVLCMVVNASFAELFLITFLSPHSMVTTLAGRLLLYLRHGTYKPRIRIRRRIRTANRAVLPMRA